MSLVRIPVGISGLGMGTGANIQRAFNVYFFRCSRQVVLIISALSGTRKRSWVLKTAVVKL